jgi:hypothetical protein
MASPKITSTLFAQLVEQAPGRVRKRLDSDPQAANQWLWTAMDQGWVIQANEEMVHLRPSDGQDAAISSLSELGCTCLLSPKCFHILACCSVLEICSNPSVESSPCDASAEEHGLDDSTKFLDVSEKLRGAARNAMECLDCLLRVGARNAGVLLQTDLLRSAHKCRASEFVSLSNALISIVEGIRRMRTQSDEADSAALFEDLVFALWAAKSASDQERIPRWMIGQTRRSYYPLDVRKVRGVLAEPIFTRSGYAGVSVLLQDVHQGKLYSVNEIRPGDASLIQQAYLGGIELGGIIEEARWLCRSSYSVQGLTASDDGRLGKVKDAKWGKTKSSSNSPSESEGSLGNFGMPLEAQIAGLKRWLKVAKDARPAGWDVLQVTGEVRGAYRDCLVIELANGGGLWRLGIPIDSAQLEYRRNFELLARCPGLRLRWYCRLRLDGMHFADALAVQGDLGLGSAEQETVSVRLDFPEGWNGICNLGLDRLERHYLIGIKPQGEEYDRTEGSHALEDPSKFVRSIERRVTGMLLGGTESLPAIGSKTLERDCAGLKKLGLSYGTILLEQLSIQGHSNHSQFPQFRVSEGKDSERKVGEFDGGITTTYLACAKYLEGFKSALLF